MALLQHNEKGKDSPASNIRRRCSSESSERPDRCQWSPLRHKDKNKSIGVSIFHSPAASRRASLTMSWPTILDIGNALDGICTGCITAEQRNTKHISVGSPARDRKHEKANSETNEHNPLWMKYFMSSVSYPTAIRVLLYHTCESKKLLNYISGTWYTSTRCNCCIYLNKRTRIKLIVQAQISPRKPARQTHKITLLVYSVIRTYIYIRIDTRGGFAAAG